ncbi:MAG: hypothetical protein EAZ91_02560 [Cytophagales bacterium]|nr:MAG: hypothetical protein EAZ91_02560 [Cytophagales bacterium]
MKRTIFYWLIIVLLGGCREKDNDIVAVNPVFQPYIDFFQKEAVKRNASIVKLDRINVVFGNLQAKQIGAWAQDNTITIDSIYWRKGSEYYREQLILHELGHLVLERVHDNSFLENGEMASIMQNVLVDNPAVKGYPMFRGVRKTYYLDELFGLQSPDSYWSKSQFLKTKLQEGSRQLVVSQDFLSDNGLSTFMSTIGNEAKIEGGLLKIDAQNRIILVLMGSLLNSMGVKQDSITSITNKNYEIEWKLRIRQGGVLFANGIQQNDYFNFTIATEGINQLSIPEGFFSPLNTPIATNTFLSFRLRKYENTVLIAVNDKPVFFTELVGNASNAVWIHNLTLSRLNTSVDIDYFNLYKIL